MMRMDSMIEEEPMEQQLNCKLSLPEVEQETSSTQPSPKEPKEYVLLMISIFPQHTPSHAKMSYLPSIPAYREVPDFVDSLDTHPPIIFKPTYFVAGLSRVVDYTSLHRRKPLFEHLP